MNTAFFSPARFHGLVAVLIGLLAGAAGAQHAGTAKAKAPPKRGDIYDTRADAKAQVAAALVRARRDNTRVLLMFGGNWCGWCHKLHALLESDPEIRKLVRDEYALVMVDTEAPNAAELLKECKSALSPEELQRGVGFPFLAVLSAEGKVVTAQRTDPLEEGDHHDPKRVKAFLTKWMAPPVEGRAVLDQALSRAAAEEKRVFLHFGAPWCGWCHKLDDFLAKDEVARTLGREFIDVKIDIDRMTGGKDVLAKYAPKPNGGIPWFAVLDAKGAVLATSDGPEGNIGYPARPQEIEHFLAMLKTSARRLDKEQIDRIGTLLKEAGEAILAGRKS